MALQGTTRGYSLSRRVMLGDNSLHYLRWVGCEINETLL